MKLCTQRNRRWPLSVLLAREVGCCIDKVILDSGLMQMRSCKAWLNKVKPSMVLVSTMLGFLGNALDAIRQWHSASQGGRGVLIVDFHVATLVYRILGGRLARWQGSLSALSYARASWYFL
jgi:hypothetical protein